VFPVGSRHSWAFLGRDFGSELREIASEVRRIGSRRGATPESLLIDKHEAADRLVALAREIEGAS